MTDYKQSLIEQTAKAMCNADMDEPGEHDWKPYIVMAKAAIAAYEGDAYDPTSAAYMMQVTKESDVGKMCSAMGDASTHKDEDEAQAEKTTSPANSKRTYTTSDGWITVTGEPLPDKTSEISEHGGDANYWKTRYLLLEQKMKRYNEPVLSNQDAAEALSKAILEAHAKWAAEYQGVGHGS